VINMKDWRLNPPSSSEERPQQSAYHVYLDPDEEFRQSLSLPEAQDDERCLPEPPEDVFSVEMPSAFVATSSGFSALPRRKQITIVAASLLAMTTMCAIAFSGGALPDPGVEPDDAITPLTGPDSEASVLRMSISPRRRSEDHVGIESSTDVPATTATLVHFSETGAVEIEAAQQKGTTYIAGQMARITALRPGSKEGILSICAPLQQIPGAAGLLRLLSGARGSLAAWVRSVGKSIDATKAQVECSGELWHLFTHGEDALVCLKKEQILEINTAKSSISVLSHVSGHKGSPIETEKCPSQPGATAQLDQPAPFSKEEMWADYLGVKAWFNVEKAPLAPSQEDVTLMPPAELEPSADSAKPKKDCVFIHGVGNTPDPNSEPILNGSYPYYWGKVQDHTAQCASWAFLNVDTVYRGWDNKTLQKEVCRVATWDPVTGKSSMGPIKNRIVFTHSMGNMMLAGAIDSGFCSLDKETSTWYEVSGPMLGSKMAAKLETICDNPGLYKWVVTKMGFCLPDGGTTPAYQSLEPSYPGLQEIAKTIASRISGAMCGTSAYGLTSIYSAEMLSLSELAGFEDINDGVVTWSSCNQQGGSVTYKADYREAFYKADANHIDTPCYEGDGDWGISRRPCSWYGLRE